MDEETHHTSVGQPESTQSILDILPAVDIPVEGNTEWLNLGNDFENIILHDRNRAQPDPNDVNIYPPPMRTLPI